MSIITGKIKCRKSDLDLPLTLLGGQSFRWKLLDGQNQAQTEVLGETKADSSSSNQKFIGVAYNNFWEIQQYDDYLEYKMHKSELTKNFNQQDCDNLLKNYFHLHINLNELIDKWKLASEHFAKMITSRNFQSVRLLKQEPFENIISFLCSQNNNITRITTMIEWLCRNYGLKICNYDNNDYYTFPTLESLLNDHNLEDKLKLSKFGYRSKYITKAVQQISNNGGVEWLKQLQLLSYKNARDELLKITGIGPKVADCICLMSLQHYESVPIDTHIFKLAQQYYSSELNGDNEGNKNGKSMNGARKSRTKNGNKSQQNITPVLYEKIGDMFRNVYGAYAGWAQTCLFCSDLKKFKDNV